MVDLERVRALRRVIEENAETMTDEVAVYVPELFQVWSGNGVEYVTGLRVSYNGKLYKVLQDHTSQDNWSPDAAPSLFAEVLPGQDGTDIGVWVQPDSTNPYMTGDRVYYPDTNGKIYESLIDNNVWSPEAYPAGWQEVVLS